MIFLNRKNLLPLSLFFFFLVFYSFTNLVLDKREIISGDSVHALLTTVSLIKDHDLNLKNNYDRKDYESFYHTPLPDRQIWTNTKGEELPLHPPGLSVLLMPAYALGQRLGAELFMGFLTSLLVLNLFLLIKQVTSSDKSALIVSTILGLSAPIIYFSPQIYREIPVALIFVFSIRQILDWSKTPTWKILLTGFLLAFIPWLHTKYLISSLPLIGIVLFLQRNDIKKNLFQNPKLLSLILPTVFSLLAIIYFYLSNYGSLWAAGTGNANEQFIGFPLAGWLGMLLDQKKGLFFNAPIYILAFLGIALHYNKLKRETLIIMAVFLPQYLLSGLHHSWDDWSPPDRYLTAFVPLLSVYLGYFLLEFKKGWPKVLFWLLAALSIIISLFSLFAVDWHEFYALIGPNVFLGNFPLLGSLKLWKLFPSFLAEGYKFTSSWIKTFFLIVALFISYRLLKKSKGDSVINS